MLGGRNVTEGAQLSLRYVCSTSVALLFSSPIFIFCGFGLCDDDFKNHRLAISDQRTLADRQFCQERQFHPLYSRLNAPQGVSAHQYLVHGEDQPENLFLTLALEFGKGKVVMRKQQRLLWRYFNANGTRLGVVRPTFR